MKPGRDLAFLLAGVASALAAVHALDAAVRSSDALPGTLPTAVMAIASLAAGVGLVALGVLTAARRSLRWWRLLAIPAVLVGVFWSVVPVGSAALATLAPAGRAATASPRDRALAYEDVRLTTEDGVKLAAWYLPSRNGAAVLALHGAGSSSTRVSTLPHAAVLARHGYGVLLLDARGHGASEGRGMEYGWFGGRDIAAALDHLEHRSDVRDGRIGLLGLSMGGEQALTAAAADPRVRAVVAEGATARTYEDVRRALAGVNVFLGVPQYRALFGTADLLTSASPPVPLEDAMRRLRGRPVMLLCTEDEAAYDRRFKDAGGGSTELWAPASDAHIQALKEHPADWERRVVGFLDRELAPER